jgi:hypothetical protein
VVIQKFLFRATLRYLHEHAHARAGYLRWLLTGQRDRYVNTSATRAINLQDVLQRRYPNLAGVPRLRGHIDHDQRRRTASMATIHCAMGVRAENF